MYIYRNDDIRIRVEIVCSAPIYCIVVLAAISGAIRDLYLLYVYQEVYVPTSILYVLDLQPDIARGKMNN